MSKSVDQHKIELIKKLLFEIHRGTSPKELREMFRSILQEVSPLEIPLIEQELVKEGISISEILRLCDLHVELFRETLSSRELSGVPRGHPVDLLMRENAWILKQAEALSIYAQAILRDLGDKSIESYVDELKKIINELRRIRVHYRKIQMLIFPYLERLGLIAVPRVLWGREDQVIVKLRGLASLIQSLDLGDRHKLIELAQKSNELASEIIELVFRENKILFPAIYVLLPDGAWTVIDELANEIGYLVEPDTREWSPQGSRLYPYEWKPVLDKEVIDKLPAEFRETGLRSIEPDNYVVRREGDLVFETGFLNPNEIDGLFRALPIEITYADLNDRVRFYTESDLMKKGFVRTKTVLGRRLAYCHPPRLENYVMLNVNALKRSEFKYREFWTRLGDRVIRVIVAPVKDRNNSLLGVVEIVEDLTEVVENPAEIKKKIMVL
ncbi:MAG: DUF438 domain-containing protein [Ignisphaera sp.]